MKCIECKEEIPTDTFPIGHKELTITCHHCGAHMEIAQRPFLGWKFPKITKRHRAFKRHVPLQLL